MTTLLDTVTDRSGHLTPELWARAGRALVAKALAEFAHERLLRPEPLGGDRYVVGSDDGTTEWHFAARRLPLDHWAIDPSTVAALRADRPVPLDALELVLGLRRTLGLSDEVLPVYLEEVGSTLAARAFTLARGGPSAAELVDAGFQTVETSMTAGHPCFVANNGRLGFSADEYRVHAPEAAVPVRLVWLAVRTDRSTFSCSTGLTEDDHLAAEFDGATLDRFARRLRALGLDPAAYRLLPVHPWQWANRIAVTFAAELACRDLVHLGPGGDEYLAQQSIRTFFDVTRPDRSYVKTALSVLNMGFLRGLSGEYMAATPAINDWVHDLVTGDPVLARTGVSVLREHAAVGYRSRYYEPATAPGSPYRKMLAALWRESPVPALQPGQQLVTMAALLHLDDAGTPFLGALVERSGLEPAEWLRRYLDAYLVPLLHCFYAHDLVFMPHGENVILVLEGGAPVRAILKDIGEEVVLMNDSTPLPAAAERIRVADVPEHLRLLSIQTDVLDCFLRHLAALADEHGLIDADAFWAVVSGCVADYQAAVPELADRFARYDLFAPSFALSCLNRLQLRNNREMVDLADPAGSLQLHGELDNPLRRP
jgi:siderophore synthetase component